MTLTHTQQKRDASELRYQRYRLQARLVMRLAQLIGRTTETHMGMDVGSTDGTTVINGQGTYLEIARELYRRGTVEFIWRAVEDRPEHTIMFSSRKGVWRGGAWVKSHPALYCGIIDEEESGSDGCMAWSAEPIDEVWVDRSMMFHTSEEDAAFVHLFNGVWRAYVETVRQAAEGKPPPGGVIVNVPESAIFKLTLPE